MDISIIVPAYNEEKYIEKTLKSIKTQRTDSIVDKKLDKPLRK